MIKNNKENDERILLEEEEIHNTNPPHCLNLIKLKYNTWMTLKSLF